MTGLLTIEPPDFSLVVATYGPGHALERLLDSLTMQRDCTIEVIVVDQNSTDDVRLLCRRYSNKLAIHHATSRPGLSRARNVGIALCTGRIVAFPDDDCWYPEGLLTAVKTEILGVPGWAGLTCRCTNEQGRLAAGGDSRQPGQLTQGTVWHRGVSATLFLRANVIADVGGFDEMLGLGADSPFRSGEESDYLLRALGKRHALAYRPQLSVFHPLPPASDSTGARTRAWSYGLGFGRVLRKHEYRAPSVLYHLGYPLLGAAVALMRFDMPLAKMRLARVLGRYQGWRWKQGRPIKSYRWLEPKSAQLPDDGSPSRARLRLRSLRKRRR